MPYAIDGVALIMELQATLVAAGDADASAGVIACAVRKWKPGEAETGYYYTGSAWQVGATTVNSVQSDAHGHEVTVDATRMVGLTGWDINARPSSAVEIGPLVSYAVMSAMHGDQMDTLENVVNGIGAASGGSLSFANNADNVDSPLQSVTWVGVETSGTNASVDAADAVYHIIDDDTGAFDIVYRYPIGGGRTASEFTWKGYLRGNNNEANIQAWNGSSWDTLAVIDGKPGSSNDTITERLLGEHTGSGDDLGNVYLRLVATGQTNPTLNTDQLIVSAVSVGQTVGYALGSIWVDTSESNTNTEKYVDGTADHAVSTWAAALTLSASVSLKRFHIFAGSAITLSANSDNYALDGENWALALGGQSIVGLNLHGASVTGVAAGTGTKQILTHCIMGAISHIAGTHVHESGISGTQTMVAAGDIFFDRCYSAIAGTDTWIFDFNASIGNVRLNLRHYSGGVHIHNMQAGDTASIEGNGQIIINANCTGGTIAVRGEFEKTDNSGGAVTFIDDARLTRSEIVDDAWDELLSGHTISGSTGAALSAGGPTGANQITVHIQDGSGNSVPDVTVSVYDSGNSTLITSDTTNSDGDIVFAGNDATYKLRNRKAGWSATVPETMVVSGTNTYTFTMTEVAPPAASSSPDNCVMFMDVIVGSGAVEGVVFEVWVEIPSIVGDYYLAGTVDTVTTNGAGRATSEQPIGATIRVKCPALDIDLRGIVPDETSQNIATWSVIS